MDGTEGSAGQPGPAERSHRSSVSSVGARVADVLVYLADDTVVPLAVENLPSLSAHELHRAVREVLQLPDIALDVFALWLVSPLLEVQLKPKHQPYKLGRQWPELLLRFTSAPDDDVAMDEPFLQFRRNVFFPKRRELQIHNEEILRLLYEEAKGNVLGARYPCDVEDCEALGALVCRLQLGPYQPGQLAACALREKLDSFLPAHLCKRGQGLFAALRGRGARAGPGEQGLLNAYRQVQEASGDSGCEATLGTHYRTYLLKCHELPFYGCAFFHGEVDKPAPGFLHRGGRKPVSVAISLEGVHVIDSREKHVLLGLRFQELSWDHTSPEEEEPILWLEFDGESEGTPVNKLLKIYSKQVAWPVPAHRWGGCAIAPGPRLAGKEVRSCLGPENEGGLGTRGACVLQARSRPGRSGGLVSTNSCRWRGSCGGVRQLFVEGLPSTLRRAFVFPSCPQGGCCCDPAHSHLRWAGSVGPLQACV
ncbi:FERM domain-containing protein 8 isoform X1 [Saimiri boliviensis]|uniref:FERM domain-containing protein 8 isoform X1 n=1 Tax=Saimiri boliviensis TaxID=27679 RepID=UPI003D785AD3